MPELERPSAISIRPSSSAPSTAVAGIDRAASAAATHRRQVTRVVGGRDEEHCADLLGAPLRPRARTRARRLEIGTGASTPCSSSPSRPSSRDRERQPRVLRKICSTWPAVDWRPVSLDASSAVVSRSSTSTGSCSSRAASSAGTGSSRAVMIIPTGAPASRRAANTNASSDGVSSHCASSTQASSGRSADASSNTPASPRRPGNGRARPPARAQAPRPARRVAGPVARLGDPAPGAAARAARQTRPRPHPGCRPRAAPSGPGAPGGKVQQRRLAGARDAAQHQRAAVARSSRTDQRRLAARTPGRGPGACRDPTHLDARCGVQM